MELSLKPVTSLPSYLERIWKKACCGMIWGRRLCRHLPWTYKNHGKRQNSRSPGRDLKAWPLDYESGVPAATLFMSMGWDYVPELRPPADVLFIPHMIHEYGQPRWNDTDRGKTKTSDKKTIPVPLCPPQIPQGLTRALTWTSVVRGLRLTAWTTPRPLDATFGVFFPFPPGKTRDTTSE
jgi:hypothetical protein